MKPFVLLSLALAAGCGSVSHDAATAQEPPAITADVIVAHAADVPSAIDAGGVVAARHTARIASRVMAPVEAVHVRAGDRVRKGARLVTLDGRDAASGIARAAATFASATQSVAAADGAVRAAEAALTLATITRTRIDGLHDKRAATTEERDRARAAFDTADGQLQSARATLAAAQSARDAAAAAREAAAIAASYTVLTAPFDGLVSERHVDPGDMATPGTPLLTLDDDAAFRLEVRVDEGRLSEIRAGHTAEVLVGDADTAPAMQATVAEIDRVDPSAHSFLVKLDVPGAPALRSGLYGRARFAGPARRALVVPDTAVVRRGQLTFVYVVDAEQRARLRAVAVGDAFGGAREVLSGLDEGARVIDRPAPALTDGQRVRGGQR